MDVPCKKYSSLRPGTRRAKKGVGAPRSGTLRPPAAYHGQKDSAPGEGFLLNNTVAMNAEDSTRPGFFSRHWPVLAVAALIAVLHILTNGRYGFHRDEWQFLSDARHLDWGFVAYPPFTPFIQRIGLELFGLNIIALRMASVLAQVAAILSTAWMAHRLGGGRLAQFTSAAAIALCPYAIFQGTEFQYSSFDYLWWILAAASVIALLQTDDARWCLAVGGFIGLGLMTKYAILFFALSIAAGLLVSPARKYLRTRWFWLGMALALLMCLPNLWWQARHGFISWQFLNHIHARDVRWGRASGFVAKQFFICNNPLATPLWIAGLVAAMRSAKLRALGFMFLLPAAYFMLARARFYYVAPAYPMLIALGAVRAEAWLPTLRRSPRMALEALFWLGLAGFGIYATCVLVPLADRGPLRDYALHHGDDLGEEIGWPELVRNMASIRDALPPQERANLGVLVGNYGEAGSLELLGPDYHLPPPISLTNSAWLRGYPTPQPTTLIVVGLDREDAEKAFDGCRLAGHNGDPKVVRNEESLWHPDIFVCGSPRLGWPAFWAKYKNFG